MFTRKSVLVLPVVASLLFVLSCSAKDGDAKANTPKNNVAAPASKAAATGTKVRIATSMGNIDLQLNDEKAPITVKNFLKYIEDKAYDGTIFHRVISNFMIQGGGFGTDLQKRPVRSMIANESNNGLKNVRGAISMARTSAPHSATNQFFINVKDNANLNPQGARAGYAVFGKVIAGMKVVDDIRNVKTGSCGMFSRDCPQEQVVIKSITVIK